MKQANQHKENLKIATAFAYGYTLTKQRHEPTEWRKTRLQNLTVDMKTSGMMLSEGTILPPYHREVMKGKKKAELEIEAAEDDQS